jgi:DNA-binding beta-propeller fold protein YncE
MRRLSLLAVVAMLAGCGTGSQPNLSAADPLARLLGPHAANVVRDDRGGSWLARAAVAQDLLYVSDPQQNRVVVYSFPYGVVVGELRGLSSPAGECVDNAQNVWVTESYASALVEYAHGGTKRIAKLADTGQYPIDCSIDPKTGDLAVANTEDSKGGQGSIAIYTGASGTPKVYSSAKLYHPFFLGYDDSSNLFIDGEGPDGGFVFGELPAGSREFTKIPLHQAFELAGGVLWDGAYVTVGDEEAGVVYQTTGAGGRIVGTTHLAGAQDVVQFWIPKLGNGQQKQQGSKLVGPNLNGASVMFWKYPSGGRPTRAVDGPDAPFGTAISKPAAKR